MTHYFIVSFGDETPDDGEYHNWAFDEGQADELAKDVAAAYPDRRVYVCKAISKHTCAVPAIVVKEKLND